MTLQGVPSRFGRHRRDLDIRAVEALERYVSERGEVSPHLRCTVVAA